MKCFIDFDDTLVHRSRMTDDIYQAFGDLSAEDLRQHYANYRSEHPFTISGFCSEISRLGYDGDRLRKLFYEYAKRANSYVFPDAAEFVGRLKSNGYQCILLSFDAEPELWQHPKIAASGLSPLFDEVHVIQHPKPDLLQSWNLTEPFVFVDDKQSEIDAMQAAFPDALCIKHEVGAPLLDHLDEIMRFERLLQPTASQRQE